MMEDILEHRLKVAMHQVLLVLYDNGIKQVSAGALMRLFGVSNTAAENWDDTVFELNESVQDLDSLMSPALQSTQLH